MTGFIIIPVNLKRLNQLLMFCYVHHTISHKCITKMSKKSINTWNTEQFIAVN